MSETQGKQLFPAGPWAARDIGAAIEEAIEMSGGGQGASWVIPDPPPNEEDWSIWRIRNFIRALEAVGLEIAPKGEPNGWRLAPREPTDEMITGSGVPDHLARLIWRRVFDQLPAEGVPTLGQSLRDAGAGDAIDIPAEQMKDFGQPNE
jgi:hypothetical protein